MYAFVVHALLFQILVTSFITPVEYSEKDTDDIDTLITVDSIAKPADAVTDADLSLFKDLKEVI